MANTNIGIGSPLIIDVPFQEQAVKNALQVMALLQLHDFYIVAQGSAQQIKTDGDRKALSARKNNAIIIRTPVQPKIPLEPIGDQIAQGAADRAREALMQVYGLLGDLGIKHTNTIGLGQENGGENRNHTVIGIGQQNGGDIHRLQTTQRNIRDFVDVCCVSVCERTNDGNFLFYEGWGAPISMYLWAERYARRGVPLGHIMALLNDAALHNTSLIISGGQFQNLDRDELLAGGQLIAMAKRDNPTLFSENPPAELIDALEDLAGKAERGELS